MKTKNSLFIKLALLSGALFVPLSFALLPTGGLAVAQETKAETKADPTPTVEATGAPKPTNTPLFIWTYKTPVPPPDLIHIGEDGSLNVDKNGNVVVTGTAGDPPNQVSVSYIIHNDLIKTGPDSFDINLKLLIDGIKAQIEASGPFNGTKPTVSIKLGFGDNSHLSLTFPPGSVPQIHVDHPFFGGTINVDYGDLNKDPITGKPFGGGDGDVFRIGVTFPISIDL